MTLIHPETHLLSQNHFAPNNPRPVLIYRDCLPLPVSEGKAKEFLERNKWIQGGTWGHIDQRHFHPNVHECYGILSGSSTMLLGCGDADDAAAGLEVEVSVGDVIVLPAGTGHCNLQSTKDYRYIGVYPEGAPKWRNELGKEGSEGKVAELRREAEGVVVPREDPVNGTEGPLVRLWGGLD